MKSLKERLAEKKLREEKASMKLSGLTKCMRASIPLAGHPWTDTPGDLAYIKKKADKLVSSIRYFCQNYFWECVKKAIIQEERLTYFRNNPWNDIITEAAPPTTPIPTPDNPLFVPQRNINYNASPQRNPLILTVEERVAIDKRISDIYRLAYTSKQGLDELKTKLFDDKLARENFK